ncbi:MAG: DUF2029 domain-containing protein [Dehalococcoidia bacterium]|nr:DUF2029 domain-containing protein [Dehalococcoidia bacterium]
MDEGRTFGTFARPAARWWPLTLAGVAGILVLLVVRGAVWSSRSDRGLLDWGSFVASGRAANAGLDPYGVYPLTFRVGPEAAPAPNLNPPVSVYAFRAVAPFDPVASQRAWYVASLALYVVVVLTLVGTSRRGPAWLWGLWALALAGIWHTLELDQIYVPLLLLGMGAWLALERGRPVAAGVSMGALAAVKPQFLLWPALLLLARHRRAALAGFATAAAFSAVPLMVDGPAIYREWLAVTPSLTAGQPFPGNSALPGVAARLGVPLAGVALAVVIVVALAGWALLRRPSALRVSAAALLGSLLAGPISWAGYTLLLLPALFRAPVTWLSLAAMALLCFPYWLVLDLAGRGPTLSFLAGSVYAWALLLLLIDQGRREFVLATAPPSMAPSQPTGRHLRRGAPALRGRVALLLRAFERP